VGSTGGGGLRGVRESRLAREGLGGRGSDQGTGQPRLGVWSGPAHPGPIGGPKAPGFTATAFGAGRRVTSCPPRPGKREHDHEQGGGEPERKLAGHLDGHHRGHLTDEAATGALHQVQSIGEMA